MCSNIFPRVQIPYPSYLPRSQQDQTLLCTESSCLHNDDFIISTKSKNSHIGHHTIKGSDFAHQLKSLISDSIDKQARIKLDFINRIQNNYQNILAEFAKSLMKSCTILLDEVEQFDNKLMHEYSPLSQQTDKIYSEMISSFGAMGLDQYSEDNLKSQLNLYSTIRRKLFEFETFKQNRFNNVKDKIIECFARLYENYKISLNPISIGYSQYFGFDFEPLNITEDLEYNEYLLPLRSSGGLVKDYDKLRRFSILPHHDCSTINGLIFIEDSNKFITWSINSTIKIWDFQRKKPIKCMRFELSQCIKMIKLKDSGLIMTGNLDGSIKVLNYYTGRVELDVNLNRNSIKAMIRLYDNVYITGDTIGIIRIFELKKDTSFSLRHIDKIIFLQQRHCEDILHLKKGIIACTSNQNINIYDLNKLSKLKNSSIILQGYELDVRKLYPLKKGQIISYTANGTFVIWNWLQEERLQVIKLSNINYSGTPFINNYAIMIYCSNHIIRAVDLDSLRILKTSFPIASTRILVDSYRNRNQPLAYGHPNPYSIIKPFPSFLASYGYNGDIAFWKA